MNSARGDGLTATSKQLFDPYLPLDSAKRLTGGVRHRQRERRALVLAATRRLLSERGCEAITVRDIAHHAGIALQTVYNLVGPKEQVITEAISEYSLFVGRVTARKDGVPSLLRVVETWIVAASACPEFARQCNLIIFTPSRDIYYHFRDIQIRGVAKLLRRQQASGQIHLRSSPQELAEQLVFFAMALWIEWADRPFPLPVLGEKLAAGLRKLLQE